VRKDNNSLITLSVYYLQETEINQKTFATDGLKKIDVKTNPNCVSNYNTFMVGVDVYDRIVALLYFYFPYIMLKLFNK